MRKQFLPIILVIGLITGCGAPGNNSVDHHSIDNTAFKDIPKEEMVFANQFETISEYPLEENITHMLYLSSLAEPDPLTPPENSGIGDSSIKDFMGIKDDWPAEYLHPDMPVYSKGKITAWNAWDATNPYDLVIMIKDTNQEDLDEYILELEASGFYGDSDYFSKELFSIQFQFNSKDTLQISSYRAEPEEWPEDILGFMPPPKKGYLIDVYLEIEESAWGDLYLIDMTEEDIEAYKEDLLDAGFELNEYGYFVMKNVSLNGKSYDEFNGYFEYYDMGEWTFYFSFENH